MKMSMNLLPRTTRLGSGYESTDLSISVGTAKAAKGRRAVRRMVSVNCIWAVPVIVNKGVGVVYRSI